MKSALYKNPEINQATRPESSPGRSQSSGRVLIHDVTLREAELAPDITLDYKKSLRLGRALDQLAVDEIDLMVTPANRRLIEALLGDLKRAALVGMVRNEDELALAVELGIKRVIVDGWWVPGASGVTSQKSAGGLISGMIELIRLAKSQQCNVSTGVSTFLRASDEFTERFYKEVSEKGGADRVIIADSLGQALPWSMFALTRKVASWVPAAIIEVHVHNVFGLAVASSLSAVAAGARVVHSSLVGIGDRCGPTPTEEVCMALEVLMGEKLGIQHEEILAVCRLAGELTGRNVPYNKPITGTGVFEFAQAAVRDMLDVLSASGSDVDLLPFRPEMIGHATSWREFYKE